MSDWKTALDSRQAAIDTRKTLWDAVLLPLTAKIRAPDTVTEHKLLWIVQLRPVSLEVDANTKEYSLSYGTFTVSIANVDDAVGMLHEWLG